MFIYFRFYLTFPLYLPLIFIYIYIFFSRIFLTLYFPYSYPFYLFIFIYSVLFYVSPLFTIFSTHLHKFGRSWGVRGVPQVWVRSLPRWSKLLSGGQVRLCLSVSLVVMTQRSKQTIKVTYVLVLSPHKFDQECLSKIQVDRLQVPTPGRYLGPTLHHLKTIPQKN